MLEGSYSFVQMAADTYPDCKARPTISRDRRTFTMRCSGAPGQQYEVWFNRPPYMNFRSVKGTASEPYQLKFEGRSR